LTEKEKDKLKHKTIPNIHFLSCYRKAVFTFVLPQIMLILLSLKKKKKNCLKFFKYFLLSYSHTTVVQKCHCLIADLNSMVEGRTKSGELTRTRRPMSYR